jgi:predicted phospho-2-dehydro-3-deoxyheptonate aldolase
MIGKAIRLERIINRASRRTVIVPMDHGMTMGPIPGISDIKETINKMVEGGANAILLHKGMVEAGHRGGGKDVGLIVHLSASTSLSPCPNAKVLVCTVEEAVRLGADAVSVHVNLGDAMDTAMIRDTGVVSKACREWGMPLVAMIYTRGEKIKDQFDVTHVKQAARVGAELGADIVKVVYTGNPETFREVVEGCPVPVVIAGGEKMETDKDLLAMVEGALGAGAAGVSIGRNAFQHKEPIRIVQAIGRMTHQHWDAGRALEFLKQKN